MTIRTTNQGGRCTFNTVTRCTCHLFILVDSEFTQFCLLFSFAVDGSFKTAAYKQR